MRRCCDLASAAGIPWRADLDDSGATDRAVLLLLRLQLTSVASGRLPGRLLASVVRASMPHGKGLYSARRRGRTRCGDDRHPLMWTAPGRKGISRIRVQISCSTGDKDVVIHQQKVFCRNNTCIRFVVGRLLFPDENPVQRRKENPGRVRPYVRGPVTRIGRWSSWVCAYVSGTNQRSVLEGTNGCSVLPELSFDQPFPSRCSAFPAGISQARA